MRASLRATYQIDLRAPGVSVADLADLVVWLPAGCAFWVSFGGPLTYSTETMALNAVEHRLRVLAWQGTSDGHKNRNPPLPVETPKYANERDLEAAKTSAKAEAWERRQRRQRSAKAD